MLRISYLFRRMIARKKWSIKFASSKVIKLVINDVVKWWRIFNKKKKNLQPLKQSAWITQWDFNLFKFYFSKTKAGGIVLSWLTKPLSQILIRTCVKTVRSHHNLLCSKQLFCFFFVSRQQRKKQKKPDGAQNATLLWTHAQASIG